MKIDAGKPPTVAIVAPSPHVLHVDGVEARLWVGVSERGTELRLAVHRTFAADDAALVRDFPILEPRERPKRLETDGVDLVALAKAAADERERCARIVESFKVHESDGNFTLDSVAAAVRRGDA